MADEEKSTKEFKESELRFALKLWKKGELSNARLRKLARSSGDEKRFFELFNKKTGSSLNASSYEGETSFTDKDLEAYYRLKKFKPRKLLKVEGAAKKEKELNEEIIHTANIVGLLENEKLKKELSKDVQPYSWRKIASVIDYVKSPRRSAKRLKYRKKAVEIFKKLPKRRRK